MKMKIQFKNIFNKNWNRDIKNNDITMEQLRNKQKNGAIVIDVRSPQEYEEGHINGAILIPEYTINYKIQEKLNNKDVEIVVYCSSGIRSKKAQRKLLKMGYKNVYNVYEGFFR
jgi:rhodanese-related sulfurtransferase